MAATSQVHDYQLELLCDRPCPPKPADPPPRPTGKIWSFWRVSGPIGLIWVKVCSELDAIATYRRINRWATFQKPVEVLSEMTTDQLDAGTEYYVRYGSKGDVCKRKY